MGRVHRTDRLPSNNAQLDSRSALLHSASAGASTARPQHAGDAGERNAPPVSVMASVQPGGGDPAPERCADHHCSIHHDVVEGGPCAS